MGTANSNSTFTVPTDTDNETAETDEKFEKITVSVKDLEEMNVDNYIDNIKNSTCTFIEQHKKDNPTFEVLGMFSLNAIVFKDKTTHELLSYSNIFVENMPAGAVGTAITTAIKSNPTILIEVTSAMKEEMRQRIEEHKENMNRTYSTNN